MNTMTMNQQRQIQGEKGLVDNEEEDDKDDEYHQHCSSSALFDHPNRFAECIREDVTSPSCQPRQVQNWDKWVGDRYKKYDQCITPDYIHHQLHQKWAISGQGSTVAGTKTLRALLREILNSNNDDDNNNSQQYNIQTFLDCPCGDWLWMQKINFSNVQYFGADITNITANINNKCFANDHVHFHRLDWSCSIPPPVDLLLVRDVLFHLSTSVVLDILKHIHQSNAKYLLTTTFPSVPPSNTTTFPRDNYVSAGVGYRNINLYGPPYNFPPPLKVAMEGKRHVGLWKLPIDTIEYGDTTNIQ